MTVREEDEIIKGRSGKLGSRMGGRSYVEGRRESEKEVQWNPGAHHLPTTMYPTKCPMVCSGLQEPMTCLSILGLDTPEIVRAAASQCSSRVAMQSLFG